MQNQELVPQMADLEKQNMESRNLRLSAYAEKMGMEINEAGNREKTGGNC